MGNRVRLHRYRPMGASAAARAAIKNGGHRRRLAAAATVYWKKGASKGHGWEEEGQSAQPRLGGALSRAVRSRDGASCAEEQSISIKARVWGPARQAAVGEGALGRPRLRCRHVTVQQPPPASCLIMTVRGMRAKIACSGAQGGMASQGHAGNAAARPCALHL